MGWESNAGNATRHPIDLRYTRGGPGEALNFAIVDICKFEPREFLPLLEEEGRVWAANLRWDYTSYLHLISNCLEEKRLQGYALVSEDQIQGYSFYFCEGEKSLIGNLFVWPSDTGHGPAIQLLERVIAAIKGIRGVNRVETQLPHFALEDLGACLAASAFRAYARRFMAVSLANRPGASIPTATAPGRDTVGDKIILGDFVLEPWDRRHDGDAAHLLYRTYRNHVDAIINNQYASEAGAAHLIDNIMHQHGCGEYLPQASLVAIHRATGKLAAILAITSVRPHTGHIPQIAVAAEFQGTGLGSAMLELSFERLARRGFNEVSLTVTDLNVGAMRLYERLGFETFRSFGAFVWERNP